ncbi:MAG: tellurium resistance protein [Paracoccaceae bacterium]
MPTNTPPRLRPKQYPAPEFPPRRPPLFSRTPPAIYPTIMGLLGLGLAGRRACEALDISGGLVELLLGGFAGLWAFAALAYAVKVVRRPGVVIEDLRVLPGRAGLAALVLGLMLVAVVLVPYAPGLAKGLLFAGLALHAGLALLMIRVLWTSAPESRAVTPVWHLNFVGFIIGALAAVPLGLTPLASWLLWGTIPVAVVIWGISAVQLIRRIPPAPLRPLLAIHLAPASLFAIVAASLGQTMMAAGFAALGLVILLALAAAAKWLTASGFSALWGAFTFPIAAYASALFALGMDVTGVMVLMVALAVEPFVAFRVMQSWGKGDLAAKTNAAQA